MSENEKKKIDGITVVSPMWGKRTVTDRMVFSVLHQYLGKDEPLNIELVLVDDYLEGRGKNDESEYDYYLSDEFKSFYDTEHIKIKLIKNKEHKYQGESREIGFLAGTYDWFTLIDCDDMLAPNACDRYRHIINSYYNDTNPDGSRRNSGELACVYGYLYSFGEHGYEHNIVGNSIWVQSRCYNRKFIVDNDIHFPTGMNSKQGEDYPFIRKLDYALIHDKDWNAVQVPYNNGVDCQATAFWFPNDNSLSRKDPHYGCHLSGWTMASSNAIIEYFMEYNKKHGLEDQEDEAMKHEVLNMTVYAFYNYLHFLREVASTDYVPLKEDWDALRKNVAKLKKKLKDVFWDEIVYSDIEDMLYNVKHHSDIQFTESWLGTFYDFINKGFTYKGKDILNFNYQEMRDYCKTLQFDGAGHEINSPQVKAWVKRHHK